MAAYLGGEAVVVHGFLDSSMEYSWGHWQDLGGRIAVLLPAAVTSLTVLLVLSMVDQTAGCDYSLVDVMVDTGCAPSTHVWGMKCMYGEQCCLAQLQCNVQ